GADPLVELRGIEPLTSSMRTKRATNCATAPGAGFRVPEEAPSDSVLDGPQRPTGLRGWRASVVDGPAPVEDVVEVAVAVRRDFLRCDHLGARHRTAGHPVRVRLPQGV